jgi:integrase/recombinase XerD
MAARRRFVVRSPDDGSAAFVVVDPDGGVVPESAEFCRWLAAMDRSAYTQRAYALGLAHFFGWLATTGRSLVDVERPVIAEYIADFRAGGKVGATRVDESRIGSVDARTRKPAPALERAPATVNHRLSVLASFFSFLIERDSDRGHGPWASRVNPVPAGVSPMQGWHGMPGRDAPRLRPRGELRMREPRRLPRRLEDGLGEELIAAARSWRDKALVLVLWRTGQRIGDWSEVHGRHGVLGMSLSDLDRRSGTITVRLKGARDEHRVPIVEEFWAVFARYLRDERGFGEPGDAAWLARGGRPLGYPTFESQLRALGGRVDARVNAHMFRHTLAQALVETSGLKAAQEILGHQHISTTADAYTRVDHAGMVRALDAANTAIDRAARRRAPRVRSNGQATPPSRDGLERPDRGRMDEAAYVFDYDPVTVAELDALSDRPAGV